MGILGELPRDSMIARLMEEKAAWEKADSPDGGTTRHSLYSRNSPVKVRVKAENTG